MELIKRNKVVIAIVLIILVLVIIRTSETYKFKNDARRWAEPSIKESNIITLVQADTLKGSKLVINLDKEAANITIRQSEVRNIPSDSILSKIYLNSILKYTGKVLLFSSEPGLSARIWMILSQMGCRNIYILTDRTDDEVFKYKFKPDTAAPSRFAGSP
jgi:hypothetical protein